MSQEIPLLKQAKELQRMLRELQRELGDRLVEGTAGGGKVRCVVNGHLELLSLKIDPAAVDPGDVHGLEELIAAAVRQAYQAALALKKSETDKVTGGILPELGF